MNNFDNNMMLIKKYRTNLYEKLDKTNKMEVDKEPNVIRNIISIKTRENTKAIEVELDNMKRYRLNSHYHPNIQAERWLEQCDLKSINMVITIFGLGSGIYINKLIDKLKDKDGILIFEPSKKIFYHVLKNYNLRDIIVNPKVSLTIGGINDIEFRKLLQTTIDWSNLRSQRRYVHPQYDKIFDQEYESYLKEIRDNNDRAVIMKNTDSVFGKIIIDNIFHNMKYMKDGNILNDYIGDFPEDIPAIIVSAGPSLDKNIEELKKVHNKAVIFGIDRSLGYLFEHNIMPDFAVTVDPLKPVKYFGENHEITVPLFTEIHSNKEILDIHRGKKIFYNAFEYINKGLMEIDKPIMGISIGSSVATTAFAISVKLGFKKIILVGQDLAYSDNGLSTHAGDINTEDIAYEELLVEGIHGNKVRTRYDWYEFLRWFGDSIEENEEIEVIDATEGGAKIRGTKVMSLKDVIDKYCVTPFDCNNLNAQKTPTYDVDDLIVIKKYLSKSREDLDFIKKTTKEAIIACDKMIINCKNGTDNSKSSKNLIKKIIKANKQMNKKAIYSLIDTYITESTVGSMRDIYQFSDNELDDKIITYVKSKEVYEQILIAIEDVSIIMENHDIQR